MNDQIQNVLNASRENDEAVAAIEVAKKEVASAQRRLERKTAAQLLTAKKLEEAKAVLTAPPAKAK